MQSDRRIGLTWKRALVLTIVLAGVFFAGVYAGAASPLSNIFLASSSKAGTASESVSIPILVNANVDVPGPAYTSVVFGNVSTVGYRTVTMFIYISATTCNIQSLYFNGYWKPDPSFPGLAAVGLTSIVGAVGASVAVVAPVAGGLLLLYLVPTSNTSCSISGFSLSVYLQH